MRANTSALCLCNVNTKRPFAFTQKATVNRPYAFTCHSRTKKTQVSRPYAFTINQLCLLHKNEWTFQSLSREARLITPIGARPRASSTTLEVTVTCRPQRTSTSYSEVISQNELREQTRDSLTDSERATFIRQTREHKENGINRTDYLDARKRTVTQ